MDSIERNKMPSGPPELHEFWSNFNEHGYADTNAKRYLVSQGYKEGDGENRWEWFRPSLDHEPTELEISAINYLMWEWDWGGICDYAD